MGGKDTVGLAVSLASAICCRGHNVVAGGLSGVVVVVAMTSTPVLSMPTKTSRASTSLCTRLGTLALPMGALPGGTIFRNKAVAGRPVIDKVPPPGVEPAELSHVLRMSMFEVELPPARKVKVPEEENAIASAGGGGGGGFRGWRGGGKG